MRALTYTMASAQDLIGIINLQKANLPSNLSREEMVSQGFVTVVHSPDDLAKMNSIEPHVIARDGESVVAYLLAMTKASKDLVPVLIPMFNMFDETRYRNKPVSEMNYIVVGQVCVHKEYRGKGVLDRCYEEYRAWLHPKYDCAVTEIAVTNPRSLRAHKRIGFKEIRRYVAPDGVEWSIVLWDWRMAQVA